MRVNEQDSERDLEQLELYLDHELGEAEARQLDGRVSADAALAGELERLRGDRATRLSAMSVAFDTDAASVERLVASVRMARASEALQIRRRTNHQTSWLPMRSILAAAACVAFGLTLGVTLQRQHGGASGIVALPESVTSTGDYASGLGSNVNFGPGGLQGHGAYIVSIVENGREVMKVHFATEQEARQFIQRVNSGAEGSLPVHVGDARVLEQPY